MIFGSTNFSCTEPNAYITNKLILKKPTTGTNWTRNCDVPLGISNNRRQTKFKNDLRLFNANCIWSRLPRLVLPSLIALARKASSSFPQCVFFTFVPPFWSAITAVCNSVSFIFAIKFDLIGFDV